MMGAERNSAIQPSRNTLTSTTKMPTMTARMATFCAYSGAAAQGQVGHAGREERRDGRVGTDRHLRVGAEQGEDDRAGHERVEARDRVASRPAGTWPAARGRR